MTAAISVRGLTKAYGSFEAVRGIDLEVEQGAVMALLGPNGAGKTTTVEILEGYRDRDGGDVTVLGFDPHSGGREMRRRVGIVLQECAVEPFLTVREVLKQRAGYYRSPRSADDIIDLLGLAEKSRSRVRTLSGGQQRRLDLALALVGDPELIFLDEPTTGFDPSARHESWEIVRQLCSEGRTVLLTTHYMDEAQELADQVVVIARGEIVARGTPDTIGGRDAAPTTIRFTLPEGTSVADVPVSEGLTVDEDPRAGPTEASQISVTTSEPTRVLHLLTGWAVEHDVELGALSVAQPSLEDVYLQLTADSVKSGGPQA